ncbi:MAG TPA: RHS repeat-associated core domain-containing protein [Candidatus Ozemobacteraceae bacterium]
MTRACCGTGAADAVVIEYDSMGRLHRVTNPAGQWVEFTHAPNGRIVSIADVSSRTFTYGYDSAGFLATFTDPLGRTTSYAYDEDGFLTRVEQPVGRVTEVAYTDRRVASVKTPDAGVSTFAWDDQRGLMTLTDPAGTAHEYRFDHDWRLTGYGVPSAGIAKTLLSSGTALIGFENTLGLSETYTYTGGVLSGKTDLSGYGQVFAYATGTHLPVRIADSMNREWRYEWCSRGNLVKIIDPDGGITTSTYDSHNNKLTETDPKGRTTRYAYDATGNFLLAVTDPMGDVTSFTYDLRGNKVSYKNPLGQITRREYDLLDRETRSITGDGRWVKTEYDASGRVAATEESDHTRTTWTYDGAGRILTETNALGAVQRFAYDPAGRRVAIIDPLGNRTETVYDVLGRAVGARSPDGGFSETVYDTESRVVSTQDACGGVTSFEYDAMGRQTAVIDPLGNRATTEYDPAGRVVAQTDALGHRTRSFHDANDRLVRTVFPDGSESRNVYDTDGRLVWNIDALGNRTKYIYNERGQQVKKILPNGAVTERVYNGMGHEIETIDPLGRRTVTLYDAKSRPWMTVDPASGTTKRFWDEVSGLLVSTELPDGRVSTTTYDLLDRPVAESDPLGNIMAYEYDAAGRQTATVDALGRRAASVFDSVGREVRKSDPMGFSIGRAFDACGRLVSLTDGAGRVWRWEYDLAGRVTAEIDPLGNRVAYGYNALGQIVTRTNARGGATRYAYDVMNRLVRLDYPDGSVATFAYDLLGREVSRSGPAGMVTKAWDAVGNLVSETFLVAGVRKTWRYSHDLAGNCTEAVDPEGEKYRYFYDALDRVIRLEAPGVGTLTYRRDPAGRILGITRAGGSSGYVYDIAGRLLEVTHRSDRGSTICSYRYTYDVTGNRTSQQDELGRVTSYRYNPNDWLTGVDYPDGTVVSYEYNGAGDRLEERTEAPLTRGSGRQVVLATETRVVPFAYDAGGRLVSRASDTYVFDADGNLIAGIEIGEETRYFWTPYNRLLAVEKDLLCDRHGVKRCGKCPSHRVRSEEYGYLPGDWRRVTRYISDSGCGHGFGHGHGHDCEEIPGHGRGHEDATGTMYLSVYQGEDESHEYELVAENSGRTWKCPKHQKCECPAPAAERVAKLVRGFPGGPGTDDLVGTSYRGKSLWHLGDALGSTIGLTSRDGHPVARIGYDAWGNLQWPDKPGHGVPPMKEGDLDGYLQRLENNRSFGEPAIDPWHLGRHYGKTLTPYLYTGRRLDMNPNLYFNRNRYYNPAHGRFISKDPIGFSGGNNHWGYAAGNPIGMRDPSGLWPFVIIADDTDPFRLGLIQSLVDGHGGWFFDTPRIYQGREFGDPLRLFEDIYNETRWSGQVRRMLFLGHGNEHGIALRFGYYPIALLGGVSPVLITATTILKIAGNLGACRTPNSIFSHQALVFFLGCNVARGLLPIYFAATFLTPNSGSYVGAFVENVSTWDLYMSSMSQTIRSPYFRKIFP